MSLFEAGKILLERGGFMELYVGLKVTVLGSFPSVGVYFGIYQFTKRQMDAIEGMSPNLSIVVSAGVGNFVARYVIRLYVTVSFHFVHPVHCLGTFSFFFPLPRRNSDLRPLLVSRLFPPYPRWYAPLSVSRP